MSRPAGRYAPSPTGEMHLGNASSALLAWASVRVRGGRFVMRMEDLDRARSRADLAVQVLDDLRWFGLDWDEGPDVGGPHAPYVQSERDPLYLAAVARLRADDRLYPCFCSRREIAAAAGAPQEPGEQRRYPGTCRTLDPAEAERRIASGASHAWRFRVPGDARPRFVDRVHGERVPSRVPGDFVVLRSDGVVAYQLAVVVDDMEMEIDEVVRGDDLLDSTPWQCLLYEALGGTPPAFAHVPLLLGADGARLSKRHRGVTLRELREAGRSAPELVGTIAHRLGLAEDDAPLPAAGFAERFAWSRVRPLPEGVVVAMDSPPPPS